VFNIRGLYSLDLEGGANFLGKALGNILLTGLIGGIKRLNYRVGNLLSVEGDGASVSLDYAGKSHFGYPPCHYLVKRKHNILCLIIFKQRRYSTPRIAFCQAQKAKNFATKGKNF
jgi:hypothetical protein